MNEDRHDAIIAALAGRPPLILDAVRSAVPDAGEEEVNAAIETEALRRIDSATAEQVKDVTRDLVGDWLSREDRLEVIYALDPSPEPINEGELK